MDAQTKRSLAAQNQAKIEIQQTEAQTRRMREERIEAENLKESLDEVQAYTIKTGEAIDAAFTAIWRVFSNFVRQYVQKALDEMQAVDDALVEVRKVTDLSDSELDTLEQAAYDTATAYGVLASDYLESVSAFARAGYGAQAEQLAELATKTQIVGDTSESTANQFLLSVDAAYKYEGSIEALSRVLDGANEIDNKYATSIEKIAAGLGKVAPIAAQAHVGVNELTAAIGTITAVTQRSGTEAATALRALFLNIIGDTKTEIDEGVTWTTGEIAGLRAVIEKYAASAVEAAEATGEVINPMEAIGALAQSMKDGLLTEQELMETVSDIGGKLRTSQLLAIIQNWDMYESMLADYANAFGSADKEVENAMDSWTRKAAVFQNTWTDFVQNTASTDVIKGFIDLGTGIVDFADNIGLAGFAVIGLIGVFANFEKSSSRIGKTVESLKDVFLDFATAPNMSAVSLNSWVTVAGAVVSAISLVVMAVKQYQQAEKEARQERLQAAKDAFSEASALDELAQKLRSETDIREELPGILQQLRSEYGMLAAARALENEKTEEAIDLLEKESKARTDAAWLDIRDDYLEAVNKMNYGNNGDAFGSLLGSGFDRNMISNASDDLSLFGEELKKLGFIVDRTNFDFSIAYDADKLRETEDKLEAINGAIITLQSYISNPNFDKSSVSGQVLASLLGMLETEQSILNGLIDDFGEQYDEGTILLAKRIAESEEILNAISSSGTIQKDEIQKIVEGYSEAEGNIENVTEAVADLIPTLDESAVVLDENYQAWQAMLDEMRDVSSLASEASGALEAFNNAASADDKGDVFKDYASMYQTIMEYFEKGLYGSNVYQEGVRALIGDDVLAALGYDFAAAGELLASDFWRAVFADNGEDYGVNFATALYESVKNGTMSAEELGVAFTELDDGSIQMAVDDIGKLADALGTTEGVIAAIGDALGIFSSELEFSSDDALALAKEMGVVTSVMRNFGEDAGTILKRVDLSEFVSNLMEAGSTAQEIRSLVDALQGVENIEFTNKGGEVVDDVGELVNTILSAKSATDEAQGGLDELNDATAEPKVRLDTTFFDEQISNIRDRLATLSNTPVIIRVRTSTISASAEGATSHPGGPTLVNEEGPEIIQEGDTARIAGGGNPTITNIEPGARVFTADETRDILRGGAPFSEIRAAASGLSKYKGFIATFKPNTNTSASSNSGGGSSYSGGSGSGRRSSSASAASAAQAQQDAQEAEIERLENIVSLRESELTLLEAQGASTRDQINKINEIRSALWNQIQYMQSIGADQAEINKLTADWYDWNKEIADLQQGMWDAMEDAIDGELDKAAALRDERIEALDKELEALEAARDEQEEQLTLEERMLAVEEAREALKNAQNERTVRTYNASTGQWEYVADATSVKNAEEALKDAEQALEDYKSDIAYQEAVEEIEAKKDAIENAYNEIETAWNEIIASVQEPAKDIADVLRDIAENATPEMEEQIKNINEMLEKFGYTIPYQTNGGSIINSDALEAIFDAVSLSEMQSKVSAANAMLYSQSSVMPTTVPATVSTIGTQQNGGSYYQFGSITLSEAQAKSMTVYELAQLSSGLSIYNSVS